MFKGLRQKIGQGLSTTPSRNTTAHDVQRPSPSSLSSDLPQDVGIPNPISSKTPETDTSRGSLVNLIDVFVDESLHQEQTDSLIDLSSDCSGPAILDISASGAHPTHDRAVRSRTSSVSSQASDSFFSPVSAFPSRQLPLPSDVESIASEAEDGSIMLDSVSKDDLYRSYCRMQQRSNKYRWKFSQVVKAFRELEKERDKLKDTMTKSQDKAFRRISELKEQIQLDQLAKVDLEQNYTMMIEEKDEVIKVVRTQIALLKQGKEVPEDMMQRTEELKKRELTADSNNQNEDTLKEKIARMSSLLLASKDNITKNREHIQKLNTENARLQESLEKVQLEREQFQAFAQKKDQELVVLITKLQTNLDEIDFKPANNEECNDALSQIESLHTVLLSRTLVAQKLIAESKEKLAITDAENCRLLSENKLLMKEIAEQKHALAESLSLTAVAPEPPLEPVSVTQNWSLILCQKHQRYSLTGVCSGVAAGEPNEETALDQKVMERAPASGAVEQGAGEFAQPVNVECVVCDKEQLLVAANDKIRAYQDQIYHLEETVNRLRLKSKDGWRSLDSTDKGTNCGDDFKEDVCTVDESQEEKTFLNDRIKFLENQLDEMILAHKSDLEEGIVSHRAELDSLRKCFEAETDQINQSLSEELDNLKEEVTQLEQELLRQRQVTELSERSAEHLRAELNAQRQSYEARVTAETEERLYLEQELKAADKRHSAMSTALQDIQSLKAYLANSVSVIVKDAIQDGKDLPGNHLAVTEPTSDHQNVVVDETEETDQHQRKGAELCIRNWLEAAENQPRLEKDLLAGNVHEDSGGVVCSSVEELQTKNDALHRLLHEWQGCVQLLKNCLEEKQCQTQALEVQLQETQLCMTKLEQQREIQESEVEKLGSDILVLEGEKRQLSDQLNAAERQIENLLLTMHDLKNLKDSEEEVLKQSLREAAEVAERSVENRILAFEEQKDALQVQLQELEQDSKVQLDSLRLKNEELGHKAEALIVQEETLIKRISELENANKELGLKHDSRERELNFLQNEIDILKNRKDASQEVEKSLNEQLSLAEERFRATEDQLEEMRNQETVLKNQVQDLLEQKGSLESMYQEQLDRRNELQKELESLKDLGSSSESKMQKALEALKDEHDLALQQVTLSADESENLRKELRELGNQNDFLSLRIKALEEDRDRIQNELLDREGQSESLGEQVKKFQLQGDDLLREAQDLKDRNGSVCELLKELEEQKESLQKEIQDLKDRNGSVCEQLKELEEQKEGLQKEIQDLKDRNGGVCELLKELEDQKESLRKEIQDQQENNGALCEQVRRLEEERDVIQRKMQQFEGQSESLLIEVNASKEQRESTLKELQELRDKNQLLQSAVEETESAKQSLLHEMVQNEGKIADEVKSLEVQVLDLNASNEALEKKLEESEIKEHELLQKLELVGFEAMKMKATIHSQEEDLKERNDRCKQLSEENSEKELRLSDLEVSVKETERSYASELSELRKRLWSILNREEPFPVKDASVFAEEISAFRTTLESQLSNHLYGLNEQLELFRLSAGDAEKKVLSLTKELEEFEMRLEEEESVWKTEKANLEFDNGELSNKAENLVKELQDQKESFTRFKFENERSIADKDRLLSEAEEKLRILSGEGSQKAAQLLEFIQELQEKISKLTENCAESERTESAYKVQCETKDEELSRVKQSFALSENRFKKAEEDMTLMSIEHAAEKANLTARINEQTHEILNLSNLKAEREALYEDSRLALQTLEENLRKQADEHQTEMERLKLDSEQNLLTKTEEVGEIETALAKKDALIKELEENLRTETELTSNEILLLQTRVKDLEDMLTLAQHDSEAAKESIVREWNVINNELKETHRVEVERLQASILDYENRITSSDLLAELENGKRILADENDSLKSQIAEMTSSVDTLHKDAFEKLKVCRSECKSKDEIILDLRKNNEEKEAVLVLLEDKLIAKGQEVDKLHLAIEEKVLVGLAKEELIRDKEKLIENLEEGRRLEKEENERLIGTLQITSENYEKEMSKLKSDVEALRDEVDGLKAEMEKKVCEIDRLKTLAEQLEVEKVDLLAKRQALIEEKESLTKDNESKLTANSQFQIESEEIRSKELEAMENRFQDKMKDLQRKFVVKIKHVQSEHEKVLQGFRAESEELRLSKATLEKQLDDLRKVADYRESITDKLILKDKESEDSQGWTEEKTEGEEECSREVVKEYHTELEQCASLCPLENAEKQQTKGSSAVQSEGSTNDLPRLNEQLLQALTREKEVQLKLEKAEEYVVELKQTVNDLTKDVEELKIRSADDLTAQAKRLEAECADKMAELKKKAEVRLKQIKNQIQAEKGSVVAELVQARDSLEAQLGARNDDLERRTELLQKKEEEMQTLGMELKSTEDKWREETSLLRKEFEASKCQLIDDLNATKGSLEVFQVKSQSLEEEAAKLRQTIQGLQEESQLQQNKIADLEVKCKGLKRQLVSAKHELDRLKNEKDVEIRTLQLDNEKEVARLTSEYKEQLKDFEIDNNSRIKQLVKDFQLKLAEKENEFQSTYMEALEKSQREEDLLLHQQKQEVKSMRLEMREKEDSYEESIQQLEVQLQAAEMHLEEETRNSSEEIAKLKLTIERLENETHDRHQSEAQSSEQLDCNDLMLEGRKSSISPLGVPSSDASAYINEQLQQEVVDLTRLIEELKIRYSLQVIKDQASTHMKTSAELEMDSDGGQLPTEQQNEIQTLELHNMDLQAQVIQQCGDLAKLKIRERALQHEVQVLNERLTGKASENQEFAEELPRSTQSFSELSTEFQYLKNVLFKFLTGLEQQTLTRVICSVLKFSEEETQAVMEHQSEMID